MSAAVQQLQDPGLDYESSLSPPKRPSRREYTDPSDENGVGVALRLIKQPETCTISQDQLVAEVIRIYAGGMILASATWVEVLGEIDIPSIDIGRLKRCCVIVPQAGTLRRNDLRI
ncbi:hypothetical protein F5Y03DRAFT_390425 [Xylaria venustula]|nr:hypothetical protein F5Y03DRAFT_390425 [Xylaria venustula]